MNLDRYEIACNEADAWRERYEDAEIQLTKAHNMIDALDRQVAELKKQLIDMTVKRNINVSTLDKVKVDRSLASKALGFDEIRRDQVFAAINSERVYQELKWGTLEDHPQSVGAYLMLMHIHLTRAAEAWAGATNDEAALEGIRKVAAIATACGEQHGFQKRDYSSVNYGDC